MSPKLLVAACLLFMATAAKAQSGLIRKDGRTLNYVETPAGAAVTAAEFFSRYGTELGLGRNDEFRVIASRSTQSALRYQQYYSGIPVAGAEYILHVRDGYVTMANGKFVTGLDLNLAGMQTEAQAVQKQLRSFPAGASVRKAELVIASGTPGFSAEPGQYFPCWRLEVRTPDFRDARVVIAEARGGVVLQSYPLYSDCLHTTGRTTHQGSKPITTCRRADSMYTLYEQCHATAGDVHIVHLVDTAYGDYTNIANAWDTVAYSSPVEAMVNARSAMDFYAQTFQRNSFDNRGTDLTVVNPDIATYGNAFWNNMDTIIILGGSRSGPEDDFNVTDVMGHELTHGVTQASAGLVYFNESGALNEAMSDIFGVAVERFQRGPGGFNWLVGDEIQGVGSIRNMARPKNSGVHYTSPNCSSVAPGQPNYYGGAYWNTTPCDNYGVHINSGVFNYWFYILAHGDTVMNEKRYLLESPGIGFDAAIKIVYDMLTQYLTPGSEYGDITVAALTAAGQRYPGNAVVIDAIKKASCATGIDTSFCRTAPNALRDQVVQTGFSVFPNPAAGRFRVQASLVPGAAYTVCVKDLLGREVMRMPLEAPEAPEAEIDGGTWNPGIYFVELSSGAFRETRKILIK